MVHRIQNRNPGYSDFSSLGTNTSFNFSSNNSNPVSHGANALKLENEVVTENFDQSVDEINNQYHEELLKNQQAENIIENTLDEDETSFSKEALSDLDAKDEPLNDLKEFGVDKDEPDLFNSSNESLSSDILGTSQNDNEEDDLEIPAFLRRQKN